MADVGEAGITADTGRPQGAADAGGDEAAADAGEEESPADAGGVESAADAGGAERDAGSVEGAADAGAESAADAGGAGPDAGRDESPADAGSPETPLIESFTASAGSVAPGRSSQLLAVFSNGAGSVAPGVGTVQSGVAVSVTPAATTTYVLTVVGGDGTAVQRSVTVAVTATVGETCVSDVSGEVGGQHWTLSKSPYCVSGDLSIASGTRLVVDPGVEVVFQGHYKVDVKGGLTAQGTPSQRIVLTAADTDTGWAGLRFWNSNGHTVDDVDQWIEHVELSFGKVRGPDTPGSYYNLRGGCVYAVDLADAAKFHFNDNYVHHCSSTYEQLPSHGGAFFWAGSHFLTMRGNVWEDNFAVGEGGAIGVVHSVGVRIEGGSFSRNQAGTRGGAARVFDGDLTVDGAILGAGADANTPNDFTSNVTYLPPE